MTRRIDLSFRVTCRECGHVTTFEPATIGDEMLHCAGCGHSFSMSHELALTIRRRMEEFLTRIPEE